MLTHKNTARASLLGSSRGRDMLMAPNQRSVDQTATGIRRQLYENVPKIKQALAGQAQSHQDNSLKGGDPAAGSPTATLLRLHPSR